MTYNPYAQPPMDEQDPYAQPSLQSSPPPGAPSAPDTLSLYKPQSLQQLAGPPDIQGSGPTPMPKEKGKTDWGAIAGLGGLVAAALAPKNSGISHLFTGGVTAYANKRMQEHEDDKKVEDQQHLHLVQTIYAKVPELSKLAPDHPGVKELQKMFADAMADDSMISPKEAAAMSVKIHEIEGSVNDWQQKHEHEQKQALERSDSEDASNRAAWKLAQTENPALSGISFEDAWKQAPLKAQAQKLAAEQAQKEFQYKQLGMQSVPETAGGQKVQLPAEKAFEQEQALKRAQLAGVSSYGGRQLTANTSTRDKDVEILSQQIKGLEGELQGIRPGSPAYQRLAPKFQELASYKAKLQQMLNMQAPGAPQQGVPQQGGGGRVDPNDAEFSSKFGKPGMGQPGAPPPAAPPAAQQARPAPMTPPPGQGGKKPLPPGMDPAKMTPQQLERARALGYDVPPSTIPVP